MRRRKHTFLGRTFASLYPDRVGKVVIDGVLEPNDWVSGNSLSSITFIDDILSAFFVYCSAAGSDCEYNNGTKSAHDLYLRLEAMVSKLNATYAFQQNWANASAMALALVDVTRNIFENSYFPNGNFVSTSEFLVAAEQQLLNLTLHNIVALEQKFPISTASPATDRESLWRFAMTCTDTSSKDYGLKLQDFEGEITTLRAQS